ncbi:MAG: XRE family transcriptional regulator [Candidatus Omnitrophica bacterium]|nr:XRE family transcriptional regulator [Candidatus Omnitrophota bacterium]
MAEKIRGLRKEKGLTLKALSLSSGVALATLSRIETGKMRGTVESHKAIASALGQTLSQLYSNLENKKTPIEYQNIENRTDLFLHNDKASYHMLTSNILSKKMMPVMLKLSSGGRTSIERPCAAAEKFLYVLRGCVEVVIGKTRHVLKKSETLYFNAGLSHYIKNPRKDEALIICVTTPPAL